MPEQRFSGPVPMTMLGELQGWQIIIRCGRCRRRVHLGTEYLAQLHGTDMRLWRLIERLRCSRPRPTPDDRKCLGRPSYVAAAQLRVYGKSATIVREVVLKDDDRKGHANVRDR